jgi:hypothetical protein
MSFFDVKVDGIFQTPKSKTDTNHSRELESSNHKSQAELQNQNDPLT